MRTLTSLAITGALGATAHANGFLLNEFDAREVGRGNAGAATDVEPSSIYYNVGGLAGAEGTRITIGGSLIAPIASFTDSSTSIKTDSNTSPQIVPGIFLSSRLNDKVAIGVGFYTPFGLAISWPATSPQADIIREEALHTFFITPSVGVNLDSVVPGLTLGGGVDIVPATVELKQDIFFGTDASGSAHLAGSATGVGGRVGAMYRPAAARQLSLGVMWRSDVKEDFSGTGAFTAPSPYRAMLPPDGPIKTSVTLPQSVSVGVAYRPMDALELEADAVWTNWSKFASLNIDVPATMGSGTMTIAQPKNYKDTVTARIGIEYGLPQYHLAVRGGFIYDPTPVPTTTLAADLPDIDRFDACLGASYQVGSFDLHLGLLWVIPQKRTTAPDANMPEYKGTFDVTAFVASVGVSGKLGGK
jgi:long-chain fatty acid transport protein